MPAGNSRTFGPACVNGRRASTDSARASAVCEGAVCMARGVAGSGRPPAAIAIEGLQQPGVHHGVTIKIATRPGDLVLDPMCGIGTTLVEASTTRSGILINSS